MIPIAWTIAGSDTSGGAGIQADLKTMNALGVHGCSIITAVTAQHHHDILHINYMSSESILAQLSSLAEISPPKAIKLGMLGTISTIHHIMNFLTTYTGYSVLDTPLFSSSGIPLFDTDHHSYVTHLKKLIPLVTLMTPNIPEVETLLGHQITSSHDIQKAADMLITLGAKNVLIKGGHLNHTDFCSDYWTNGIESCWYSSKRYIHLNYRGTGCTLASAITVCLALGYTLKDALVIGKMFTNQSVRLSQKINAQSALLSHTQWPEHHIDLPYVNHTPVIHEPDACISCGPEPLGLYPIVDSLEWLKRLIPTGIKTAQLRMKHTSGTALEHDIKDSITLCKKNNVRLFINDHWKLALKYDAYGVHLGQEDIVTADIHIIRAQGLRLGISTHCYHEVARAHTLNPSYIACGPIFTTTSKIMPFQPQGITALNRWQRTLHYPLVAIGGINDSNIDDILKTGVNGIAMISAITQTIDPLRITQQFLKKVTDYVTQY